MTTSLFRLSEPNGSKGWITAADGYAPEPPWRPATRREKWQWRLTAQRYSLVDVVMIELIFAFVFGLIHRA